MPPTKNAKPTTIKPTKKVSAKKATVLSSKVSYRGKVFTVTTDQVTEPGGVTSERDVVRHGGSVVILAVDATRPRKPAVVVIRQYRHAAGQFLFELPAGRIDEGERPLAAAKRELIEETGYRAKKWSSLTRYYASPGFLAETMEIFLAEDLVAGEAQPEEDEKIEVSMMPLAELTGMIQAGKILDGKTMIGTLLYASRRFIKA